MKQARLDEIMENAGEYTLKASTYAYLPENERERYAWLVNGTLLAAGLSAEEKKNGLTVAAYNVSRER